MNQIKLYAQFVLFLITYSMSGQDVKLDVEGNVKIVGKVDLIVDEGDSTSLAIGRRAGDNLNGNSDRYNTFVGVLAGQNNSTGLWNSFFGHSAGSKNINASGNSFFGITAGYKNTVGEGNSFFGRGAGWQNEVGHENSFFGEWAGFENTTGLLNSFFGSHAGYKNTTGTRNTFLGSRADQVNSVDSLDRAIAIGFKAEVGCSNCAVIGGTGADAVKVGIGTSNPSQPLEVYGNIRATGGFISATDGTQNFQLTTNASEHYVQLDVGGADNALDDIIIGDKNLPTNKVGIGTSSPTQMLDINGNIRVRNVSAGAHVNDIGITSDGVLTTASSDANLKKDIETYSHALNNLLAIRGVSFKWKDQDLNQKQLGVIAQEVQEHIPEIVFENDGYLGVNYSQLSAVFIEAIKELHIQIDNLRKELQILKKSL